MNNYYLLNLENKSRQRKQENKSKNVLISKNVIDIDKTLKYICNDRYNYKILIHFEHVVKI